MKDDDTVKERFFDQPGMLVIAPSALGQSYPPSPYSTMGRLLAAERKAKKEEAAQRHHQVQVVASSAPRPAPPRPAPPRPQARRPVPAASTPTQKPRGPSEAEQRREVARLEREVARLETSVRVLEASTSARTRALAKQDRARDQTKQEEQTRVARAQAAQRERDCAWLDQQMGIYPKGGCRREGYSLVYALEHNPPPIRRSQRAVFGALGAVDHEVPLELEDDEEVRKSQRSSDEPVGGTSGTAPRALAFSFDGTTRRLP